MTRAATVIRHNGQLRAAYEKISELQERSDHCSLSDSGNWTNQNVVFTKTLLDMFPLAKTIVKGALLRDECRGAHYKPDFAMPSLSGVEPQHRLQQAEAWCDRFDENNRKWLKTTVADWGGTDPEISYEDVDVTLIPPRPRLYGLAGADLIEDVWHKRQRPEAAETQPQPVGARAQ